eukprot:jgi/Undpi1/5783/HiC_scaffold_2.g01057.m1
MAAVELSVFGLGSMVDITTGTLALTGVVGFTVVFEMAAHRLEHHLAGTPYMGMLAKIYKELMIMGFIALGVFLTLELGSVGDSLEFFMFEFAHIVIFFTTLIFVMQACLMMVFSAKLKNRYERSTNISVDHLLSIYSLHRKSKVFHARWLPLSDLREVMEFKIVHAFFRTTFALPTNFDFALYMREASDSHILSLVDVEGSTWFILAVVCFLNLARVKMWQTIGLTPIDSGYADDDHATDDHATSDYDTHASDDHRRRWLAGGGGGGIHYTNTGSDGEATFIMFGWMLLCTAIGNYIMSRWVEIRLLRKAGCNSTNDYQERLCVIEKHFMEAKRLEEINRKGGAEGNHLEELKKQVDDAKKMGDKGHHKHKQGGHSSDDASNLQSRLSRHLDIVRKHAKATYSFGSGDGKKGIGGSQPSSPFRLGGTGNKSAATFLTPADRTETEVLAVGSLSTSEEMSEESQPPPPKATAQQAGSEGSAGVENGAWVGVGESAGVGLVEAEAEEGRAETGVVAEAGSGVSLALLRMYKEVAERSGSGSDKTEKTGEIKAGGGWGEGREGEGGGESKSGRERENAEERGEIGGRHERMSAGDDGLGNRRVISIPPGAEGTTDNVKQPSLKLVIAREAPTISEDGQCSNRNVSDIEGPSVEAPASPGSDSSHASAGRRASLIKHQVRRMSMSARKLTAKLASDVTSVARKISNAPHNPSTLDLFNDISDIYPLSSPTLFHKTLDVLLLFSCTYLVLDEQIDQEKLLVQFRERLKGRLDELGLGKSGLEAAFEEVDVTGRGELTIKELSQVLFRLNFHASKEKYKKLFNAMDKNRKGVVSYHQLFELVYIEEAAAQTQLPRSSRSSTTSSAISSGRASTNSTSTGKLAEASMSWTTDEPHARTPVLGHGDGDCCWATEGVDADAPQLLQQSTNEQSRWRGG